MPGWPWSHITNVDTIEGHTWHRSHWKRNRRGEIWGGASERAGEGAGTHRADREEAAKSLMWSIAISPVPHVSRGMLSPVNELCDTKRETGLRKRISTSSKIKRVSYQNDAQEDGNLPAGTTSPDVNRTISPRTNSPIGTWNSCISFRDSSDKERGEQTKDEAMKEKRSYSCQDATWLHAEPMLDCQSFCGGQWQKLDLIRTYSSWKDDHCNHHTTCKTQRSQWSKHEPRESR